MVSGRGESMAERDVDGPARERRHQALDRGIGTIYQDLKAIPLLGVPRDLFLRAGTPIAGRTALDRSCRRCSLLDVRYGGCDRD